jgi:S1-C subfamily serine protease/thioredoxin-related protein
VIPAAPASDEGEATAESARRRSEVAQQGSGVAKRGPSLGGRSGIKDQGPAGSSAPELEERQPWEEMDAPNAHGAADFLDSLGDPADAPPGRENDNGSFAPPTAADSHEIPQPSESLKAATRSDPSSESPQPSDPTPAAQSNEDDVEDDVFSAIVSQPAKRPATGAMKVEPSKPTSAGSPHKSKLNNKAIWITVGAVSAVLLIGVGILIASGAFKSAPAVVEAPAPAGPPMLVVDWPQGDRGIGKVVLDGKEEHIVTDETALLEYPLTPGEHKLRIHRAGSAPIDALIPPQNNGARYTFKPDWKPGSPVNPVPDASEPTRGDRPVAEGLPDLKKWQVEFDTAKKEAQQSKKDLLVVFFGADRRDWCMRLAKEVLLKPSFRSFADPKFVFVLFEAPGAKFDEGSTGAKLTADYRITNFPMLVLADSDGLPYAEQDYMDPGHHDYIKSLQECNGKRAERDKVYEPTKKGTDEEKLAAADKFVKWLEDNHMAKLYDTKLKEWIDLADRVDPKNEKGYADKFFLAGWEPQFRDVADKDPKEILEVAEQLDKFRQKHKFKDSNRAAKLHIEVARLLDMKGDQENTARFLQGAKDCDPTDKQLRRFLEMIGDIANAPLSSGSGFAIADGGYLVTNNHVVEGRGHLWVRISGEKKELRATAVATDSEHDIALVKLDEMPEKPLKPLSLSGSVPGPGADIGVFGYPLGDSLGGDLKFTFGKISAPPDKRRDGMYLLDCKVNHGNSGGPMCDARGQVVGLVSAKTTAYGGNDSYGMALPPDTMATFLKAHLPNFKPASAESGKKLGAWDEVYSMVSPSVVMMLKRTN